MNRLACLSLHAEKLHDEEVWRATQRLAVVGARQGRALTFFVHPFWAVTRGIDISDRVRHLAELGHEIGQHTHYYDVGTATTPGHKVDDLNPANVLGRLEEDYQWLCGAGTRPRGFVSGAWALPDVLAGWLAKRDFAYDCTYRTYALPYRGLAAAPGDLAARPLILESGVAEVPTTASLRSASLAVFRLRLASVRIGDVEYQLVYLHDHDLLDRRKRVAFAATLHGLRVRGFRLVTGADLAQALRPNLRRTAR